MDEPLNTLSRASVRPTSPDERQAIYALRNAFAHDFSVASTPRGAVRGEPNPGWHRFELSGAPGALIELPSEPWNRHFGERSRGGPTRVSLRAPGDLVESIVGDLEGRVSEGTPHIRAPMSAEELQARFTLAYVEQTSAPTQTFDDDLLPQKLGRRARRLARRRARR